MSLILEESAKNLFTAMKDLGIDSKRIISIICKHSNDELQILKKIYMTMYGRDLEEQIEDETSGRFREGVLGLLKSQDEYDAEVIRKAIKGLGTDEDLLIEILCSQKGYHISKMSAAYKRLFNRDLYKDISKEQSGDLGRVFKSLASGGRPSSGPYDEPDFELAETEADELFEAGEGKLFGTDEAELIRILCSRSFKQLKATFEIYEQKNDTTIEESIKSETSGDFKKALNVIARCVKNRAEYFAECLYKSMKGFGTNDDDLIRVLVSERDVMEEIKSEYEANYGESLYDAVKGDTSGKYEKLFLTLIGSGDDEEEDEENED